VSVRERRAREQAERRQLIITAARQLAGDEGWDAVTTRRLADVIEYSQPVLYQHFANKEAIVQAVALDGFAELAEALHAGRESGDTVEDHLRGLVHAYMDFAQHNPVLYQAMFELPTSLEFGKPDSPAPLVDAFLEIISGVIPIAGERDPESLAEVIWSSCHGLANLAHADRLRPDFREQRIVLLVEAFLAQATAPQV
jgi:AcrR family transcriptional regulator